MAFVSTKDSARRLGHVNSLNYTVDIVGIPAIGGDPVETWGKDQNQWLAPLGGQVQGARVLLYDHYTAEERAAEVKPRTHPDHQSSAEAYAKFQTKLARFNMSDWADRLLNQMRKVRNSTALHRRPLVFVCHSTGGIVLKQALCKRLAEKDVDLAASCILVIFFATPHRGSSVLSGTEFARAVKNELRLKWELGETCRKQLTAGNPYLDTLNHKFSSGRFLGMRISNYVELQESSLEVLTDAEGESLTRISRFIVDPQSSEINVSGGAAEEDVFELHATHKETANLADDSVFRNELIEDIKATIKATDAAERAAHQDLIKSIMQDVKVDVHQFFEGQEGSNGSTGATKIWSEQASLVEYLEVGPGQVLQKRLTNSASREFGIEKQASFERRPTSPNSLLLVKKNPRRPSVILESSDTSSSRPSSSQKTEVDNRSFLRPSIIDEVRLDVPHRAHTLQTPTENLDKFRWIHVPYSVTGWVGPVLRTVSKEKGHNLHKKLLMDQLWTVHHNRSRHSSHHSKFVRPHCRVLTPSTPNHDEILSPSSASEELQLALFMPYINWDSFSSLKARNEVIKNRSAQDHAQPIDRKVVKGKSVEHKLIWQFLDSNAPIHCRRSLDQYGYPSLQNTDARDMDQVMYKRTRTKKAEVITPLKRQGYHFSARLHARRSSRVKVPTPTTDTSDGCVLMVDSLWAWVLGDEDIITFTSSKEREDPFSDEHLQADLRGNVLKDVSGDFARKIDDCFDQAALLVFHCVKALFDYSTDPSLNVFRTFEEHISEISEMHTIAFKQFRDSHKISDPKQLLDHSHSLDYSNDLDNLLELRDVDDELNTIKKLVVEQRKITCEMMKEYEEEVIPRGKGIHGLVLLKEAESTLLGYEEQVDGMIASSKSAQEAFENLLDLKQKHSNIVEAHMTRYQTEMASEQSRSVMIFTVITIVFLPLSFFSSIFGMNVSEWSGEDTNPSLPYVLKVMGFISLAVVVVALLAAFNFAARRFVMKICRRAWHLTVRPLMRLLSRSHIRKVRNYAYSYTRNHKKDLEKAIPDPPTPMEISEDREEEGKEDVPKMLFRAPTDLSENDEAWDKKHMS